MKLSRRSQALVDFADYFLAAHEAWQGDANRRYPDDGYWDSVDELLDAFEEGDIPDDCRALADAVVRLNEETIAFYNRNEQNNPEPQPAFWAAVEAVKKAREPAKEEVLIPLESIASLDKQGVPHWQIAMIYGLVPKGEEMNAARYAHLIQKEMDHPNSVIGPDWIDPRIRDKAEKQQVNEQRHQRIERQRRKQPEPPAPESIRELLEQGVSIEQICTMKQCPMEDVLAEQATLEKEEAAKKKRQKQEA